MNAEIDDIDDNTDVKVKSRVRDVKTSGGYLEEPSNDEVKDKDDCKLKKRIVNDLKDAPIVDSVNRENRSHLKDMEYLVDYAGMFYCDIYTKLRWM